MLQRAAGWCKAVQGIRGKILSELSGCMGSVRPSKQERQAPVITGRALLDVH